jgi:signal transduction histidine kinase
MAGHSHQGTMDKTPIKVLLLEDSEEDALSLVETIEQLGFSLEYDRVYSRQGMLNVLHSEGGWELIIAKHAMPDFSSTDAQRVLLECGIETPLIIVSDDIGGEAAIESVRAGAHDFVKKDNLSRLGAAITRALQLTHARAEARAYQQRLRDLFMHQEEVRERERVNIAREVHDELGGVLTAIKMDVSWLQKKCGSSPFGVEEKFLLLAEHLEGAINTVRRIITDLRPSVLDDLGLVAALEWQLNEFEKRYNIKCRFDNQAPLMTIKDKGHEIAIFRIFQESLTNIAKHARANRVEVRLTANNNMLHLEINDNGTGISEDNKLKSGHYGILGMKERTLSIGGSLEVTAAESDGTRVSLRLPV